MRTAEALLAAFATTVALAGAPAAQAVQNGTLNATSANFLRMANKGGRSEIALATMAESKSTNSRVKSLAQTIRHDHEAANSEIKFLADKKGVTLTTELSKSDQATADRLGKLSGAAFDKAYAAEMIKDHKADVAEFQKHEQDRDPDVAAWATKTLPALQNHLTMALEAEKAAGGK